MTAVVNCDAMMVSCQYSFLCRLQLVSRHVVEVQEIDFKKFGTELRRGWPPTDFSWQCYYMLGTTNKLGVHDMQQASPEAEPGDYKHAVNDM